MAALLAFPATATPVVPPWDSPPISTLSCRQLIPPTVPPPSWSDPQDGASRFRLSRWCETVGAVFLQPVPLIPISSGSIDRLAIVSWNVHEGGGDVDDLLSRLRAGQFTGGQAIEHVVLLLQEVRRSDSSVPAHIPRGYPAPGRIAPRRSSPDGDVHRFADQGFAVLYAPSMRNGRYGASAEDRGNAIVSTLALADPRLVELPLERQRRVAAAAAVEGKTSSGVRWRLELVNVHLDTALSLGHVTPFAARRRQVLALLAALPDAHPAGVETATLLGGDLNTWGGRHETALRVLSDAFPDTPDADEAPTWRGPLGLHASLDHIFVRGHARSDRVIRIPNRFGSDHYPLLTVLRF